MKQLIASQFEHRIMWLDNIISADDYLTWASLVQCELGDKYALEKAAEDYVDRLAAHLGDYATALSHIRVASIIKGEQK